MPLFKYKAVSTNGKSPVEILIEGDTQKDSLSKLRAKGFTPIKFLGETEVETKLFMGVFRRKKNFDCLDFTNRLVPLLNAHIQLERALGILGDTTEDEYTSEIAMELRRGLHEGKKFSTLIRERSSLFPAIYANLVEAGEESGSLAAVMNELKNFLNERKELRDFLITSSIYPAIILTVTGVLVTLLVTIYIPRFASIFKDLGKELPLPTKILLNISHCVTGWYSLIWISLFILLIHIIKKIKEGGQAKLVWDEYVLKLPLFGPLVQVIEITRFLRTLSVLLKNFVPLLTSVSIAQRVIFNETVRKTLSGVVAELKSGRKISSALSASPYIPETATQMLAIGEETGDVAGMLDEVADYYEAKIKSSIKKLLALFEPFVILVIAVIVLAVVSSIFIAIIELQKAQ